MSQSQNEQNEKYCININFKNENNEEENQDKGLEKVETQMEVKEEDDEEELKDPIDDVRDKCKQISYISNFLQKYHECSDRVNNRIKITETCQQELFDYAQALDHCVSKHLFKELK